MHWGDKGQAAPLVAGLIVVAGVVAFALAPFGEAVIDKAKARTAADAAALAGAAEGEQAAREMAAANGAELLDFESDGTTAEVTVAVGKARARARARREGGGSGLAPAVVGALRRALR
jgi:hypothetical protein